jgi:uncharacterized cupredoxin-like copper-binding protein
MLALDIFVTKLEPPLGNFLASLSLGVRVFKPLLLITLTLILSLLMSLPVQAATNVTEIKISLGNTQGERKFFPNNLEFIVGEKYKLVLDNPSPEKHYFTAKDFADASWTQKVEAGKVEVKGAIHELELKPSGEAEWVLIPMKAGSYDLYCSIPGHKEAGMTGKIVIKES